MPQANTLDAGEESLSRTVAKTLRDFQSPHPAATSFIKHADLADGCQRHVMICARSLSSIGCMPPPAQESAFRSIIDTLEQAMESAPCWPSIRPLLAQHWEEFTAPPGDCLLKARNIVSANSQPFGRYTAGCRPPTESNAMQTEALEGIQEAHDHMVGALAGAFIQYSLTSDDYRTDYQAMLVERLNNRIAAINHLDQNCAFTLHTSDRWKNTKYQDEILARLFLWGDRVNSAKNNIRGNGESRTMALVVARRRLGKTIGSIIQSDEPASLEDRKRTSEIAAYWLEVANSLTPLNSYQRAYHGIDKAPDLTPNRNP